MGLVMDFGWPSDVVAVLLAGFGVKVAVDAVWILLTKRPVLGVVVADSYGEARSYAARIAHPHDWLYKVTAGNAKPAVGNDLTVRYTVDETELETIVHVAHLRGDRPEPTVMLWYDPADPASATDDGPGRQLYLAAGLVLVALSIAGWVRW